MGGINRSPPAIYSMPGFKIPAFRRTEIRFNDKKRPVGSFHPGPKQGIRAFVSVGTSSWRRHGRLRIAAVGFLGTPALLLPGRPPPFPAVHCMAPYIGLSPINFRGSNLTWLHVKLIWRRGGWTQGVVIVRLQGQRGGAKPVDEPVFKKWPTGTGH